MDYIGFLDTLLRPGRNNILPVSASNPLPVSGAGAGHQSDSYTTSLLGAGATYTSPTVDQGASTTGWGTRLRSEVVHAASLTHGHLTVEQSPDNATWRETERVPVPSDGAQHGFEFPIHQRYYRTKFINGAVAQTAFFAHSYRVASEGTSVDVRQNLQFVLSTSALAAGASFTAPVLDLGSSHQWNLLRMSVRSDQAGTLALQASRDNATWAPVRPSDVGVGGAATGVGLTVPADSTFESYAEWKITKRYLRPVHTNGATAQVFFDLNAALINL